MDWLGEHLWAVWLAAAGVLGVAEMLSLDLVLIMLAVGAVAGMVLAIAGAHVALQVVAAAAVSVALVALVRPPIVKRLHGGPDLQVGHGKLVGRQAVVTEEVRSLQPGRIKLAGEIWTAVPYDESIVIAPGETVEVFEIKGATAYVHPVPRLES